MKSKINRIALLILTILAVASLCSCSSNKANLTNGQEYIDYIESVEQLDYSIYKIAVCEGTDAEKFTSDYFEDAEIIFTTTEAEAFMLVQRSKADAAITGNDEASRLLANRNFDDLMKLEDAVIPSELALCTRIERNLNSGLDENQIVSAKALDGRPLGAMVGSIFIEFEQERFPNSELVKLDTVSDEIQALETRKVDAILFEDAIASFVKRTNDKIFLIYLEDAESDFAYIMNKDNSDLVEKFNLCIRKYQKDGTLAKLKEKWLLSENLLEVEIDVDQNYEPVNGTLEVIANLENEGFSFYQNGAASGYEVELCMMIAKELGYKCNFTNSKFSGLLTGVSSKKADIGLGCITYTVEREKSVAFTDIIYESNVCAVVRNEANMFDNKTFLETVEESFYRTFIDEERWQLILKGLAVTLVIAFFSAIFGTVLGFFFSFALRSKNKIIRSISSTISAVITGMPLVVLLMINFYVIFAKTSMSAVVVAVIGFSIDFCITVAGLLNTGIMGVSEGQQRAALALGYKDMDVFSKVVFPQAAFQMFDQYKSAIVALVKSTAIVGFISVEDLTRASDIIRARTYEAFFPLIASAIIYLLLAIILVKLLEYVSVYINPEKRTNILKGIDPTVAIPKFDNISVGDGSAEDVMIKVRHLMKTFNGGQTVILKDVNADVHRGDVITIIGPSGTGKSTFLNCLNKLETPTDGEVVVLGNDIMNEKCEIDKVRQREGMVFQSFNLFEHKTIIENVMMAPMDLKNVDKQTAYQRAMMLLDMVGMAEKVLSYPKSLSGGQKQRVAIARTLAMEPDIILFDEPTSALDPSMVGEVKTVIKKLAAKGYTMLIVTHDMGFAKEVSNRVFYMDEGIIYDDNTPENIFDNPQNPKTRSFIKRMKNFSRVIDGRHNDYIAKTNELIDFGKSLWLSRKTINYMVTVFEEIVQQLLQTHYGDEQRVVFTVEYSEATKDAVIYIDYAGTQYNPMDDCEDMVKSIIENTSNTIKYRYDDMNHLVLDVKEA